MTPLRVSTDIDQDGVAILAIEGGLHDGVADDLATAITAALTGRRLTHLVLDLARVPVIDATAVDSLVQARSQALRAGATFRVIRPQPPVRRVLDTSGTCQLLTGTRRAHVGELAHPVG
jgi:stage II sporulation protein AA (anti-sigma F factor antagonist)